MGKFKIGDKVLIKARIVGINKEDQEYLVVSDGDVMSHLEVEVYPIPEKTYKDGLNEAWELAYKIVGLQKNGAMSIQDTLEIFGTEYAGDRDEILHDVTAHEAIEIIKAWEGAKEIYVGDVVIKPNKFKGVVSCLHENIAYVIWDDGSCGSYSKDDFIKTGRTIDIESLLKQIGGTE